MENFIVFKCGHSEEAENIYLWKNCKFCKICRRERMLINQYGISSEEFDLMFVAQMGLCAICFQPPNGRSLDVDHNHDNEKVRDLLCHLCNKSLGGFQHDIKLLKQAINYLEETK